MFISIKCEQYYLVDLKWFEKGCGSACWPSALDIRVLKQINKNYNLRKRVIKTQNLYLRINHLPFTLIFYSRSPIEAGIFYFTCHSCLRSIEAETYHFLLLFLYPKS